jgi:hypothetical protein
MDDKTLRRRVEYLLAEAAFDPPPRDQSITMTLRVISNVTGCGRDVGAQKYKDLTRFISRNALNLREANRNSRQVYYAGTINEHPDELADVWKWIVRKRAELTVEDVLSRFQRWPMVVITKDEDRDIRPLKGKGPEARYAEIEVLELSSGVWEVKKSQTVVTTASVELNT